MKKYRNIIVLGIIVLGIIAFIAVKTIDFDDVLLDLGYYDTKISLMNTADIHGHILYENELGYYSLTQAQVVKGMPLIKSVVDENRSKNKYTMLLDSGDLFHGTNEANINDGEAVVKLANLMGYNAMVPGNHDFNYGINRLIEISTELNFPILSSNILIDGKTLFEDYKIIEMGGKKIGVFGLTVEDALKYANTSDLGDIIIEDPVKSAKRVISILQEQCDAIILISHLGDDIDKELVKKVDGIDLIFCGHHHWLYKKPDYVNETALVESGGYATHLGIANIYFKNDEIKKISWKTKTTTNTEKIDKDMDLIAQEYHELALEEGKEIVGETKVRLNGLRAEVRSKETNLANLLTDSMKEIGDAEITLMNGGGIRQSIPEGEISLYDLGNILPFYNSLVTIEMQGDLIYKCIERGLRQYPNGSSNGGFLQVSGINYVFDGSKQAGERLVSVTIDGQPLDKEKIYTVATNDYLFNGGDEFEEFKETKMIRQGALLKDVLAQYIREKQTVEPTVEKRITVINERYK